MHHYIRTECDQPNQAILREQIQHLLNRVGEVRELLDVRASVDAEYECGRTGGRDVGEFVLARCELRNEFGG